MKTEIYIRADASPKIGHGHIIRCLSIAQIISNKFHVTFYCLEIPKSLIFEFKKSNIDCILISAETDFLNKLCTNTIVILDGYQFNTEYQKLIKAKGCKLVCIDDLHNIEFVADLIINHAPGIKPENYKGQAYTEFALGLDYALLRPIFLHQPQKKDRNQNNVTLFICFGGADNENHTENILNSILENPALMKIIVVLGNRDKYISVSGKFYPNKKAKFYQGISAEKMCNLMDECQIAIVPSSTIAIEAFSRNLAIITGMTVDNQKSIYTGLSDYPGVIGIGNFADLDKKILNREITFLCKNDLSIDHQLQEKHKLHQIFLDKFQ